MGGEERFVRLANRPAESIIDNNDALREIAYFNPDKNKKNTDDFLKSLETDSDRRRFQSLSGEERRFVLAVFSLEGKELELLKDFLTNLSLKYQTKDDALIIIMTKFAFVWLYHFTGESKFNILEHGKDRGDQEKFVDENEEAGDEGDGESLLRSVMTKVNHVESATINKFRSRLAELPDGPNKEDKIKAFEHSFKPEEQRLIVLISNFSDKKLEKIIQFIRDINSNKDRHDEKYSIEGFISIEIAVKRAYYLLGDARYKL